MKMGVNCKTRVKEHLELNVDVYYCDFIMLVSRRKERKFRKYVARGLKNMLGSITAQCSVIVHVGLDCVFQIPVFKL